MSLDCHNISQISYSDNIKWISECTVKMNYRTQNIIAQYNYLVIVYYIVTIVMSLNHILL